jgi:hypothetical protein
MLSGFCDGRVNNIGGTGSCVARTPIWKRCGEIRKRGGTNFGSGLGGSKLLRTAPARSEPRGTVQ